MLNDLIKIINDAPLGNGFNNCFVASILKSYVPQDANDELPPDALMEQWSSGNWHWRSDLLAQAGLTPQQANYLEFAYHNEGPGPALELLKTYF